MRRELRHATVVLAVFVALLAGVMLTSAREKIGHALSGAEAASAGQHMHNDGKTVFLGETILPPRPAPDFELVDWTGERMRMRAFQGKLVVLSFTYTYCPDTCPLLVSKFQAVQREMESHLGNDLAMVFITVDPERDTPERLRDYLEAAGGQRWHFLTGTTAAMEPVWKDFRVFVEKRDISVAHTNLTYLIDRNGLMRLRYLGLPPDKVLVSDLETLLR